MTSSTKPTDKSRTKRSSFESWPGEQDATPSNEKRNDADYALRSVHLKLDGNQCSAHLMYMRNLMHDKRSALA